jgi:hypothetical protein
MKDFIENNFVPYHIAFDMKSIGFDEPCIASFTQSMRFDICEQNGLGWETITNDGYIKEYPKACTAPTYAQAFRFFRNNYKLHSHINSDNSWNISGGIWDLNGYKDSRYDLDSDAYKSYPEAELACLIALINIVKSQSI